LSFDSLDDHMVVGFLGGIVPRTKINFQRLYETKNQTKTYELQLENSQTRIHNSESC
jgi:hypothetical protein